MAGWDKVLATELSRNASCLAIWELIPTGVVNFLALSGRRSWYSREQWELRSENVLQRADVNKDLGYSQVNHILTNLALLQRWEARWLGGQQVKWRLFYIKESYIEEIWPLREKRNLGWGHRRFWYIPVLRNGNRKEQSRQVWGL